MKTMVRGWRALGTHVNLTAGSVVVWPLVVIGVLSQSAVVASEDPARPAGGLSSRVRHQGSQDRRFARENVRTRDDRDPARRYRGCRVEQGYRDTV